VADSVTRAQHRDTESNRQRFFSLIGRHLSGLYHVVRHELAYREAIGDLLPGEVAVEDVVDAVLLSAYREFVKEPPARRLGGWLIERARQYLAAEVKRSRSERKRTVHIEEDVPETPPQQFVSTLGDEILDFHEPDEDLKLEDIVPDLTVPTPEQETEAAELRRCVDEALVTDRMLGHARAYLRQRLVESGCAFQGADGR
jgi:DNA-directed RNA polymerase specialized sigma24 family protein